MPDPDGGVPKVDLQKRIGDGDYSGRPTGKVNLSKSASAPGDSEIDYPVPGLRRSVTYTAASTLNSPPVHYGGTAGDAYLHKRSMTLPVMVGLLMVAAIALFGTVVLVTHKKPSVEGATAGTPAATAPAPTQPCATPPNIVVRSLAMSASGLTAAVELTASCDSGDIVTDRHFGVMLGDGGRDVAAGAFDLQADPIVIPQGKTAERTFVFPAGMFWRTPELVSSAEATALPSGSGSAASAGKVSDGDSTLSAVQPMPPKYTSADDAALSSLRDLAAADRSAVSRDLENLWVPQISSKRPGLVAEGMEWSPADILREHLALRERYSDVKLVWSGDWSTFNGPDWWVTVVGEASVEPEAAIRWCVRNGLDADHCYAKLISSTRGTEGTTILQK